jgi:hypothetical protein
VRLERLGQLKNPRTSSGIEPAAFLFVAQCLNQLRYRVPLILPWQSINQTEVDEQEIVLEGALVGNS